MLGAERATCNINPAMIKATRKHGPKKVSAVSMVPEYMVVARLKKPMNERMSMSAMVRRDDVDRWPRPLLVVGPAANIWPFSTVEAALNGLAPSPASRARRKAHQRQWFAISEHTTLN